MSTVSSLLIRLLLKILVELTRSTTIDADQAVYWQHQFAKIEPPSRQDFEFLQDWMKSPSMGNVYLLGADSDVWETYNPAEQLCLRARPNESTISRFITNWIVPRYHRLVGRFFRAPDSEEFHRNTVHYSHEGIVRLSAVAGTVIASMLMVGSIAVLYYLESMEMRLAAIGGFSALFSIVLGVLTGGRMVEMFSATAA